MRRLLQFGTFFLLLVSLVSPVTEFFDRWDSPGLAHDSDFGMFCLVFLLCLVLLVSRLMALAATCLDLKVETLAPCAGGLAKVFAEAATLAVVSPAISPPLRI